MRHVEDECQKAPFTCKQCLEEVKREQIGYHNCIYSLGLMIEALIQRQRELERKVREQGEQLARVPGMYPLLSCLHEHKLEATYLSSSECDLCEQAILKEVYLCPFCKLVFCAACFQNRNPRKLQGNRHIWI